MTRNDRRNDRSPAVECKNLAKSFNAGPVLQDVDIQIERGEVHGLVGENGSGKSTLIKILAGYHAPDPGTEMLVDGKPVSFPLAPGEFQRLGFAFVHQHLGLVPSMTVLENLFVGEFAVPERFAVSWKDKTRRAEELFGQFGLDLDPRALVQDLSPTERALLAIVRATEELRVRRPESTDYAGLLVLDEVTVFLPAAEVHVVYDLVRDIASSGASVLFVSHHIDQIRAVTDRVSVLRDGRLHGPLPTHEVDDETLVRLIIGADVPSARAVSREVPNGSQKPAIVATDLHNSLLRGVSLTVAQGEIVGLAGLAGSGHAAVLYALYGADHDTSGRLRMAGQEIDLGAFSPRQAVTCGMALVPSDRARDGGVGAMTVGDNVMLMSLGSFFRTLLLRR